MSVDVSQINLIAQITRSLYLSDAASVTQDKIEQLGITHILTIAHGHECPDVQLITVDNTVIDVKDGKHANIRQHFAHTTAIIKQVHETGGRSLVHCVRGESRGPTVCIAYLMTVEKLTLKQAYVLVKSKRCVINPSTNFWNQLIEHEQELFGKVTVKMVMTDFIWEPDIYLEEAGHKKIKTSLPGVPGRSHSVTNTRASRVSSAASLMPSGFTSPTIAPLNISGTPKAGYRSGARSLFQSPSRSQLTIPTGSLVNVQSPVRSSWSYPEQATHLHMSASLNDLDAMQTPGDNLHLTASLFECSSSSQSRSDNDLPDVGTDSEGLIT